LPIKQDPFRFKWWALFGVSLLAFTAFLDATIVNTALPFIQTALQANILQLQWIANIFTIILSMTMIACGKVADLWGRKRVFYVGVALFGLAALGAGFSSSVAGLVFFRGAQALGAATVFVVSAALISTVFPPHQRVRAIGLYSAVTGFGLLVGPFLGGILVGLLSWRWVFWINIPLIAVGFSFCTFSLKDHTHQKDGTKVDKVGLLLLIFGLGSLMYGIIRNAQEQWNSILGWFFLGAGLLALIALTVLDESRKNPLLDLPIFKNRLILLGAMSCALAGVVSTVFMFFDPLYLRIVRQLSPFHIGFIIAILPAAQCIISLSFDRLVRRFGIPRLLFFSILIGCTAIILHRLITADTPIFLLIIPLFLLGINWGMSNPASIAAINEQIAPHKIGAAIGTIATIWNIVGSLTLAISTAIFHAIETRSSFLPAFYGAVYFNIIFAVTILALATVVYKGLKKTPS
jgi:EmrB/QacA subfamily drug resistance transporter